MLASPPYLPALRILTALIGFLILPPSILHAQQGEPELSSEGLNVFLDLTSSWVDFDHLRREIAFVNWMRDRQDAHLHILGTSQLTGSGGREHTFYFIGLKTFTGRRDTLCYVEGSTETETESRDGIVQILKMGLMPYVAATSVASRIRISYTADRPGVSAGPTEDRWDWWVFAMSFHSFFNGQSHSSNGSYSGSLSANRTTEDSKYRMGISSSYSRNSYEIPDVVEYVNTTRSLDASANAVWGLSPHWSAGFSGGLSQSTYSNQTRLIRVGPAFEFNVFPYSESTRRELTWLYRIGPQWIEYEEETIFNKLEESVWQHALIVSLDIKET
ncbi:hypothetical protein ACFL44_02370, partial [Gemmatimonadota bacterium]